MEVNLNTPRPTADINAGRHRPGVELNSRASRPRPDIGADASRPRLELNHGTVNHRRPPDAQNNDGRSPRADVDYSRSLRRSESGLGLRRPHVDPIDFHDLSDGDMPPGEVERPRPPPQWESAEEVDRTKPRKLVDRRNINYEKIYPKDQDLANCRYTLTPQNNIWTKPKIEGQDRLGSGGRKKWPRGDRQTNWTQKMRTYLGTSHAPKLHQYNTAYTYDNRDPPYNLTYLNSQGFSHAIDKPRGVAAAKPYGESSGVPPPAAPIVETDYYPNPRLDAPRATIHATNPVEHRAAVVVQPPQRPTFTMDEQSPEFDTDEPFHSPNHYQDTPRANIHIRNPAKSRPGFNIRPPNLRVPKPKVPISNLRFNARNRNLKLRTPRPTPTVQAQDPQEFPILHAEAPIFRSPNPNLDSPRATIHAPNPSIPRAPVIVEPQSRPVLNMPHHSPELDADVPLYSPDYHMVTPRATNHTPAPVRSRRGFAIRPPNVSIPKPKVPISNLQVRNPNPSLNVDTTKPIAPIVQIHEPQVHRQSPELQADVPAPHYQAVANPKKRRSRKRGCCACGSDSDVDDYSFEPPRASFRAETPPLIPDSRFDHQDHDPRTYDIRTESPRPSPDVEFDTPRYSMNPLPPVHLQTNPPGRLPAVKQPIAPPAVRVSNPKPVAKPAALKVVRPSVHVVKPKAEYRVPTPKQHLRAPNVRPINLRKPNLQFKSPNFVAPKPKVPVSNLRVAAPKSTINAFVNKPVAPTAQVQVQRKKFKKPEVPKAKFQEEAPKPKADADLRIGARRLKPIETPSTSRRSPETAKPKITTPRQAPKMEVYTPMPMGKPTFADLQINAPRPNPVHIPSVSMDTPEEDEPEPIVPKADFQALLPEPKVKPMKAELHAPSPETSREEFYADIPKPTVRPLRTETRTPSPVSPRAEFHGDVPKPTLNPWRVETRTLSPDFPRAEFHADSPKSTVNPRRAETRTPSPASPRANFQPDFPKPILKPQRVETRTPSPVLPRPRGGFSEPWPNVRSPVARDPEARVHISPPRGRLPSPEARVDISPPRGRLPSPELEFKPSRASLPPVSAAYNPPAPNAQVPPPARGPPPASVALPKLPKPPRKAAPRDRSHQKTPAPRERRQPDGKPPLTSSKSYQPPKVEPLKWRLRPDETNMGNRQSSPPASVSPIMAGHLTYYPPSNVGRNSPRQRARIY